MRFKDNKEITIKRVVFVLLIILTATIQNTPGLFPRVFGVSAMLLIPLTVSIAMFESDMGGMILGLLSGIVWDFYAVRADGFYALILVSAGYACSFLIARYMRNNVMTAVVFCSVTAVLCAVLYWLIFVLPTGAHGALKIILKYYLISIGYTILLTPIYYYFVRMIALKFRKEEKEAAEERLDEAL